MNTLRCEFTNCHVVALPFPGRGHINPMMNMCKLLHSKSPDIKITFIVTEEWLDLLGSESMPLNIKFLTLPNVIPSEKVRALDYAGFIEAVYTKMEGPFEELLDQLESPVSAIIADTALYWAVAVGNRRDVAVVSLWPMSPSLFSVFYHFDLFIQNQCLPVDLSIHGREVVDYIPGISPTRLEDLPPIFDGASQPLDRVLEAFSWVRKAQSLLFTSFYELEMEVTDTFKEILPFPVYSIGPSIPYTTLGKSTEHSPASTETKMDYFKWLDSHPKTTVLYISLGIFLSVSSDQMDEIMYGLRESGVTFMWVARETSRIQEVCGEKGLVVPWCDQLKVLCHPSVGGFLTHCGWNSTLEGVFAGVPMLTFPIFFDQFYNKKVIVDDLKVGLKVEKVENNSLVKREDIGVIVKRFMDLDDDGSIEMRRRASELKETCRGALVKGGSSDTNLDSFVMDILKCHC